MVWWGKTVNPVTEEGEAEWSHVWVHTSLQNEFKASSCHLKTNKEIKRPNVNRAQRNSLFHSVLCHINAQPLMLTTITSSDMGKVRAFIVDITASKY